MRDILASLLRYRGYTHDEGTSDDYWYHPSLGVRPLMVCIQWEIDREARPASEVAPVVIPGLAGDGG